MKEYGWLCRTLYAVRYLSDESYRWRIGRQLNQDQNLYSLRRALTDAHQNVPRRRKLGQRCEQKWCLTLATNAIICWMTEYEGLAVSALRHAGRRIDDEALAHICLNHHSNVHLHGPHTVDIAAELAALDANGYRPLRRLGIPVIP